MYFKDMKQMWIAKYKFINISQIGLTKKKYKYTYYTFPEWYYFSKTGLYRVQYNSCMENI